MKQVCSAVVAGSSVSEIVPNVCTRYVRAFHIWPPLPPQTAPSPTLRPAAAAACPLSHHRLPLLPPRSWRPPPQPSPSRTRGSLFFNLAAPSPSMGCHLSLFAAGGPHRLLPLPSKAPPFPTSSLPLSHHRLSLPPPRCPSSHHRLPLLPPRCPICHASF